MRDITIGQYYPVESIVHSLDPRTKLMSAFLYIVALFLVKQPLWYLLFLLITLAEYRLAKVPFGYFMKGLRTIRPQNLPQRQHLHLQGTVVRHNASLLCRFFL